MKRFRFSLKAIFGLMAVVAVACAVLFAVPEYLRLTILFLGVISMPGPLAVLARYGAPHMRAFGLGGLVAYAAWLVLVGVPGSFFAMRELGQYMAVPLSGFGTNIGAARGGTPAAVTITTYLVYAGLYAPWIAVPAACIAALGAQLVAGERTARSADSATKDPVGLDDQLDRGSQTRGR
jgi:hypothetical protein